MHNAISALLEKRGIKNTDDLKPSERAKYDVWMRIFEKELKIADLASFIKSEISRLEDEWLESDDKNPFSYLFEWKKNLENKGRIRNYKALLAFIEKPEKDKQSLEKYLKKLIKS